MGRIKEIVFFVFIVSFNLPGVSQTTEMNNFGSNPGNLRAYIHAPVQKKDSIRLPLVIVLHGCSQDARDVEEQSGWSVLADSNSFYVLYPEQKRINNVNNCFNWFMKGDQQKDKGEVLSVYQMMQKTIDSLQIDTNRIYIYGLSAGAMLSVSMMVCYPENFNSGAVLGGGPYGGATNAVKALNQMVSPDDLSAAQRAAKVRKQNPAFKGSYPDLIVMHGEKDKVVDYRNGLELIKQWKGLYPDQLYSEDKVDSYDSVPNLTKVNYKSSETRASEIIFYSMKEAGHTLPVNPGSGPKQGGKTGMFASDLDFFSTWYIAKDFGLLK